MENIFMQFARKQGQNSFRKRLGVYSYRMKHSQYHKKPGLIDLHTKEELKKQGVQGRYKIYRMERDSDRLFGQFSSRSKFLFDSQRVPFLDIPDLTDFELKPYVSVHTPRIEKEDIIKIIKLNDFTNPENFNRYTQIDSLEAPQKVEKKAESSAQN
ncbi:hypothetical protein ABPG74_011626 [Tetrahymena malaccensis]